MRILWINPIGSEAFNRDTFKILNEAKRSLDVDVHDFQADRDHTCHRLLAEGRKAIEEDGAKVLILGCSAVYGFYQEMQDALGVPVIDGALAPFKYAEFLAALAQRFGWYPSRMWGSEAPPRSELADWGIFDQPVVVGASLTPEKHRTDSP